MLPNRFRAVVGWVMCLAPFVALALPGIETRLLDAGTLNKKDLAPLVGNETGSVTDYLLNVWHWDAAILLLGAVSIICAFLGVRMLTRGRQARSRADT